MRQLICFIGHSRTNSSDRSFQLLKYHIPSKRDRPLLRSYCSALTATSHRMHRSCPTSAVIFQQLAGGNERAKTTRWRVQLTGDIFACAKVAQRRRLPETMYE